MEWEDVESNETKTIVIAEVASKVVEMKSLLTASFKLDSFPSSKRNIQGQRSVRRRKYYDVGVESIADCCFCIPSYPEDPDRWDEITYILPVQRWAGLFDGKWSSNVDDDREETGIRPIKNKLLKCIY